GAVPPNGARTFGRHGPERGAGSRGPGGNGREGPHPADAVPARALLRECELPAAARGGSRCTGVPPGRRRQRIRALAPGAVRPLWLCPPPVLVLLGPGVHLPDPNFVALADL